jgi:hypothetical protein
VETRKDGFQNGPEFLMATAKRLTIKHIESDFPIERLCDDAWKGVLPVTITTDWSGEIAPEGRQFETRLLWSDSALYVRFDAIQREPLVVIECPQLSNKTIGLWERDVCEVFIAPDAARKNKYFEFEIAPTGEWIDLGLEIADGTRKMDLKYTSGMTSAAKIEKEKIVMGIKIPFVSFGKDPTSGDVWLGNIFRCVGKDPTRGYLAWQPTKTAKPNFHAPDSFGEFHFIK